MPCMAQFFANVKVELRFSIDATRKDARALKTTALIAWKKRSINMIILSALK
jgi:hypothetical protein